MTMQDKLRAAILAAQSTPASVAPQAHDSSCATPQPTLVPVETPSVVDDDTPAKPTLTIKNLNEKAVLVQVKRRMYSPYKHDAEESEKYGAGNVNKHLFEGRNNRVKEAISKYTAVYNFVKDNTVPWTTGVELLNITNYLEFNAGLRPLIAQANQAVEDLYNHWDYEVTADLNRLSQIAAQKGKPNIVNPSDYPDADTMRARFSIEVRYMPVPTADGFDPRLGITDEDKATVQKQIDDASAQASKHVLLQMMKPMENAIAKLNVPIGTDGSVFRESMIENMVDVSSRMAKVNLSDDPVIAERIKDLQSLVSVYANNTDVLRNSPTVRAKAANQLDDLMSKMRGLV